MKYRTAIQYSVLALCGALAVGCASNSKSPETGQSQPQVVKVQPEQQALQTKSDLTQVAPDTSEALTQAESGKFPMIEVAEAAEPMKKIYYFGFNKADIAESDLVTLQKHAAFLQANPEVVLQINGHTDPSGPRVYNEYLSKKRAEAIAKSLIEYGAPESQLTINALADTKPLKDEEKASKHRRVELEYTELNLVSKE